MLPTSADDLGDLIGKPSVGDVRDGADESAGSPDQGCVGKEGNEGPLRKKGGC